MPALVALQVSLVAVQVQAPELQRWGVQVQVLALGQVPVHVPVQTEAGDTNCFGLLLWAALGRMLSREDLWLSPVQPHGGHMYTPPSPIRKQPPRQRLQLRRYLVGVASQWVRSVWWSEGTPLLPWWA